MAESDKEASRDGAPETRTTDSDGEELGPEGPVESPDPDPSDLIGAVSFEGLTPTEFEAFCFDLVSAAGFSNVDWRKGTPRASSPADQGRDIVAEYVQTDVDGHKYSDVWFIDCKHYERGVPPEALNNAVSWAEAERPSVLLFIASGYLTNGAKTWIDNYIRNNNPRFRIRVWELPQLRNLIARHQDVAFQHDVHVSTFRRISDILAKENELYDRLWYGRKPPIDDPRWGDTPKDVLEQVDKGMRAVEERIGKEVLELDVSSDFTWGVLTGSIVAIRWVLGDEWGNADS
ncbi:restriction endonuclease [Mycobacterium sp. 852002-51057_SCH5723018]|uniref:restriction endonuclease n=1 Tax=Mycobacterium sp. 852002-51057_SCH5723018 TaxID=1834094 RepID=UPI0009EDE1A0|nr:restriction endonuclease [Mycobacterium sp. 852002-51057_SCH5723018]